MTLVGWTARSSTAMGDSLRGSHFLTMLLGGDSQSRRLHGSLQTLGWLRCADRETWSTFRATRTRRVDHGDDHV